MMNNYKKIIFAGFVLAIPVMLYAATPDSLVDVFTKYLKLNLEATKAQTEQLKILNDVLVNSQKRTILGGSASRSVRLTSSASATTSVIYTSLTSTTTALTLGCNTAGTASSAATIGSIDTIGVSMQAAASTSAAILIIQPQVSNNCVDWFAMSSISDQVTTAGTAVGAIALNGASTTVIRWTLGQAATSSQHFVLRNLASNAIRFRVSSDGATSTIWMQTSEVDRVTGR